MSCGRIDSKMLVVTNKKKDYECLIHVVNGSDVEKAMQIIEKECELMEHPNKINNHKQRNYYYYNDPIDVFTDALEYRNIKAIIWNADERSDLR